MQLALATKEANAAGALTVASRQMLLLIALGYGIAYIVPTCINFAGLQVKFVSESAPPRVGERIACELPGHRLNSAGLQPAVIRSSLLCCNP